MLFSNDSWADLCFDETAEYESRIHDCEIEAALGNADAQFMLADMYHNGLGVQQDNIKAYRFYLISTNSRKLENDAVFRLKELSKGMTPNQIQQAEILAYEYFVQSELSYGIPSNDAFAFWVTAAIYQRKGEYFKACLGYLESAEQGSKNGSRMIVEMLQNGEFLLAHNNKRNLEWYKKSATEGSKEAMLILAYMYFHGKEVAQNKQKAINWYKQAAQLKPNEKHNGFNVMAMYLTAWMYDTGQGVEQDHKQAFEWYKKAADAGYGDAQLRLAEMYQHGLGIEQNNQLAIEWYQTAAEQDYHKALRVLANLYRTGTLLKQDSKLAFEWYKKAAVLEDLPAQYALAEMYYQGEGTAKDDSKA